MAVTGGVVPSAVVKNNNPVSQIHDQLNENAEAYKEMFDIYKQQ